MLAVDFSWDTAHMMGHFGEKLSIYILGTLQRRLRVIHDLTTAKLSMRNCRRLFDFVIVNFSFFSNAVAIHSRVVHSQESMEESCQTFQQTVVRCP